MRKLTLDQKYKLARVPESLILVNDLDKHQSLVDAFPNLYNQHPEFGQPLLISVKTLPNIKIKIKTNTPNPK